MSVASDMALVEARDISAGYGKLTVLTDVSIAVRKNDYLGIVGHNGAGKSTLLSVLAGLHSPSRGSVNYAPAGDGNGNASIVMVPQGHAVFPHMRVSENLSVAVSKKGRSVTLDETLDLFPILRTKITQFAGNLSGGEQQSLAIAMGVRMAPDILLLDEPSLGLAPILVEQIMDAVDNVRTHFGCGVVVVEQNMQELMHRVHDVVVLSRGRVVWSGKPGDISDMRDLWAHF